MKKIKLLSFSILAIIAIMAISAVGMLAVSLIVGGGALLANSPAGVVPDTTVTTETAKDTSENLLRPDISKAITKIMPAAAPLDTLIREAGAHEKTGSMEFRFYSSELRAFQDELDAAFVFNAEADSYEITVKNASMWQKDDGIVFHGVDGVADGLPLVALIIGVNRSTKVLTVVFLNGDDPADPSFPDGSVPANIADDTKLGRLGNAKSELDAQTDPYGHLPLDAYNYSQQFMAQVQESFWQKWTNKEVDWDIRDMQTLALFDMRCQMEASAWFGVRSMTTDPLTGKLKYTTGGVIRFINNKINIPSGAISDATWNNWSKRIFVGNAGSDRRYLFVGSDFNERLSEVPHIAKQIDGKSTEVVYGITFNKIQTNFGELLLKHAEGFNTRGFGGAGVVLDLNNIRKRVFDPMKVRKLDLMASGISKANAYVIEENFGLETRYAGTHALLLP